MPKPPAGPIDVLLVANPAAHAVLRGALAMQDRIRVAASLRDARQVPAWLAQRPAHVVLIDATAPLDRLLGDIRAIMQSCPCPIVVCGDTGDSPRRGSMADARDGAHGELDRLAAQVREAGAVAWTPRPGGDGQADPAARQALLDTIRLMAEVKVVRRRARAGHPSRVLRTSDDVPADVQLVCIGASTGGPPVLQTILSGLPATFPAPILVVQHLTPGFLPGMAKWLEESSSLPVHVATAGTRPLPGHVYLAPDDRHLGVDTRGLIVLSKEPREHHVRPAVSYLFRSAARALGSHVVGVLLTGMGRDGADELKRLKDLGAVTIAQDEDSAAVHGMPGSAIAQGGATRVLPADAIAAALRELAGGREASTPVRNKEEE